MRTIPQLLVAGTMLASAAPAETLSLTMKRALEIALEPEGSVRMQLAREFVRQAESQSGQARAALLPRLDASVSQQSITRNLEAFGIRFEAPGFRAPEKVGPFGVFDARVTGSQNILDLSSIRRFQASRAGVEAARADGERTRDQVAQQVAFAYLAAQRAEASVASSEANVELARELLDLAETQKRAGSGTGIDITRARVQMLNEQQKLLVARNGRRRAELELLRAMDLRLDTKLELADTLARQAADPFTPADAIETAMKTRPDLKAQQRRQERANLGHSAAGFERLPSLAAFADYGSIGTNIGSSFPTRTYGVALRVPLFDGGSREARRAESASQLREERIRTEDLRARIELEIRLALDGLASAEEEIQVAEEGLVLAIGELEQARRRFQAGLTTSVEVTEAQTRLARARDNRIEALFHHNRARLELAQAMGTIQAAIR